MYNMENTLNLIVDKMNIDEKTNIESVDSYDEVAMQIVDTIKENFSDSNRKLDDEIQKKIADILKKNFDKRYENIGRNLVQDVRVFDHRNGHEFVTPLFTVPLLTPLGVMAIRPETFPNYNIENKYIGYTDKERFYRINGFTLFMRYTRKQPLIVVMIFLTIYMIIAILFFVVK